MQYSVQVEINRPMSEVVTLFDNPNNYPSWMAGLLSIKVIEGKVGQIGTKSLFRFKMGNKEMEMTETVLVKNLPNEYTVSYDANGVSNTVKNTFSELDPERTLYVTYSEFEFTGFMKFIAFIMPGSFKKTSQKYLDDFKKFAERN